MAEREQTREREAEAKPQDNYQVLLQEWAVQRERNRTGKVVVKDRDRPWEQGRQGRVKFLVYPTIADTAVRHFMLFIHDIRTHSGRHRHQGGLALFVLEGKGWTVVDGQRFDWEEGDLILLPVRPNGVVHQHYNAEPGTPCKWLAMIFSPLQELTGYQLEQVEDSPDFKHA